MGQRAMRAWKQALAFGVMLAASTSCGDVVRSSRAPVLLTVNSLAGIRGGPTAGIPAGFLLSDVLTLVTSPAPCTQTSPCATVFDDTGDAQLSISLKDQGTGTTAPSLTPNNFVTITRVHVQYIRADLPNGGRQGVDVPYEYDTAATGTITSAPADIKFELVRHAAKAEPPLVSLASSPDVISTIARVTFYGTDAVGNAVSVMGQIQVNFANFGDTQ